MKEKEERKRTERALEDKWESLLHEMRLMRDEVDLKERIMRETNRKVEVLGECLTNMADENQVLFFFLFLFLSSFLFHFSSSLLFSPLLSFHLLFSFSPLLSFFSIKQSKEKNKHLGQ